MELVNASPIPAKLFVSEIAGSPSRFGMITAKATYHFDASGPFDLDIEKPFPLLPMDIPTPLGLLPRDDLPRGDRAFEVIVLGRAHSPTGKPIPQSKVMLRVGKIEQQIEVFGDRHWTDQKAIGSPHPFTAMPLVWERAFGGSAEIEIDKDSIVSVADPTNAKGKGFNHLSQVENLRAMFTPPAPYPRPVHPKRPLPNLEDPKARIKNWDDTPKPVCWATLPMDLGLHATRSIDPKPGELFSPGRDVKRDLFYRAHPNWVIAKPPANSVVYMEGLTPEGIAAFRLPSLSIFADWIVGKQSGSSQLIPQMLVILPEEHRFTITYKFNTDVYPKENEERSIRLRLVEGW